MDEMTLQLSSPITDEQMDAIMDVDFDCTNWISFHTKHGRDVSFIKADRVIEILEENIHYEQGRVDYATATDDAVWARAHHYAELILGMVLDKIKRENEDAKI